MSYVSLNLTYRHIISKSESLSKKGKIYRNFVYGLVVIRSYIGCWYPVRRKWNQEVWWWRWRGLGTVCWGSTITLIIRWRGGQWGEPDQSSSLDLTLHPLQTCSHLHVRTDWRPAGLSVRRARQDPNTRNAHRHHWLVRDGFNMFLLLKVWTQS